MNESADEQQVEGGKCGGHEEGATSDSANPNPKFLSPQRGECSLLRD